MHPQAAGEVLSALGLDVVDLHRTKRLDPCDLQSLSLASGQPRKLETALKLGGLHWIYKPDLVSEDASVASRLDTKGPATLPVRPAISLEADAGINAEAQQQALHAPDELLRDHVDFHDGGRLPGRDKALCLEHTPEICRRHRKRCAVETFWHHHVHAARQQAPTLDDRLA